MHDSLRLTELNRTNFPEIRDLVLASEAAGTTSVPRRYPHYPSWPLKRVHPRRRSPLDRTLTCRRSSCNLGTALPSWSALSRLLLLSHGITGDLHRGPTPSSGGLQALELYLTCFGGSWLPAGLYHYERLGHQLTQLAAGADRDAWIERVPSLTRISGGALLWVVVGDTQRVGQKYGIRGDRFLLLEAGHLMQNLCLLSTSLGLVTVPLGAFYDHDIAREFALLSSDRVLYLGACG